MNRVIAAAAVAALAGSALAQSGTVTYLGQDYPGQQGGGFNNGGVFNWRLSGGLAPFGDNGTDLLRSFCIEIGENVGNGAAQINTRAIGGGRTPGDGSGDDLEFQTAYLFTQFKLGTNGDFANDFSQFNEQRGMQLAIWYFEEGLGTYDGNSQTWTESDGAVFTNATVRAIAAQYITAALAAGWTDLGNVRALNIGGAPDWGRQDMLIMIPLPQAGALAGLGLVGLATRRRR